MTIFNCALCGNNVDTNNYNYAFSYKNCTNCNCINFYIDEKNIVRGYGFIFDEYEIFFMFKVNKFIIFDNDQILYCGIEKFSSKEEAIALINKHDKLIKILK